MIKLSEHRTALINLGNTIDAIEEIDLLINRYSEDKPGPAYCNFEYMGPVNKVQFDRSIILVALKAQRQRLVDYLETLGIEA